MKLSLNTINTIQNSLNQILQNPIQIQKISPINIQNTRQSFHIITQNQSSLFLKTQSIPLPHSFQKEALSLITIQKTQSIKTPKIIAHHDHPHSLSFIALEYFHNPSKYQNFNTLAQQLASLYQHNTPHPYYGFHSNNYIGSNPQINTPSHNWTQFFVQNRLQFQISLAQKQQLWPTQFQKMWLNLKSKIPSILPQNPKPSLLHGDLWIGNILFSNQYQPVLIDPAVYYGHFETDIAMTQLFGGFPNHFYDTLFSILPLQKNYTERFKIYNLYHLINHLNLFGKSYLSNISHILQSFQ